MADASAMHSSLKLAAAMAVVLFVAACSSGPSAPDDEVYLQEIADHRGRIDKAFREQTDEPIPAAKRDTLLPPATPCRPRSR